MSAAQAATARRPLADIDGRRRSPNAAKSGAGDGTIAYFKKYRHRGQPRHFVQQSGAADPFAWHRCRRVKARPAFADVNGDGDPRTFWSSTRVTSFIFENHRLGHRNRPLSSAPAADNPFRPRRD